MNTAGEIVRAARAMRAAGLVTSTVGNVSARVPGGVLITPTRLDPEDLTPDDLVLMMLDGDADPAARRRPSLEWPMHLAVYRARPDVQAIAHTHSPHAVARSFDPSALVVETEERHYLGIDLIEVAPPHPAGSDDLAAGAATALGARRAVLLARHGVLGVGSDPRDAVEMCKTVEVLAHIAYLRAQSRAPDRDAARHARPAHGHAGAAGSST